MSVSNDGVNISNRFFMAIDALKRLRKIRGLHTFTKANGINYWNMTSVKKNPSFNTLKPEWIYLAWRDYGVSPNWLVTGRGQMFDAVEGEPNCTDEQVTSQAVINELTRRLKAKDEQISKLISIIADSGNAAEQPKST